MEWSISGARYICAFCLDLKEQVDSSVKCLRAPTVNTSATVGSLRNSKFFVGRMTNLNNFNLKSSLCALQF